MEQKKPDDRIIAALSPREDAILMELAEPSEYPDLPPFGTGSCVTPEEFAKRIAKLFPQPTPESPNPKPENPIPAIALGIAAALIALMAAYANYWRK